MDWSERHLCIKCDKGGNVLLCNENGCPLAVHEGCLGGPARLDDAGRFYCPYCVYKQAVAETRKAREFSLAKKKALLIFMDGSEKGMRESKTCEENGRNQTNVNYGLCEDGKSEKAMRENKTCEENKRNQSNVNNGLCEDGKSKANNDGVIDQPREEEKVEEDSESSGGSEDEDRSLEVNGGNGDIAVGEKQIREVEREASMKEENIREEEREAYVENENVREEECGASAEEENAEEKDREASDEEENTQGKDFGTSLSSTNEDSTLTGRARATRGPKRIKLVDKESEAISVLQSKFSDKKKHASPASTPAKKSARSPSSALATGKVVIRKLSSPSTLRKSEKQSKKL